MRPLAGIYSPGKWQPAPKTCNLEAGMINVRHRFHGHNGLRQVYQRGQTARSAFVTLKYTERPANRPYRAAVVVSRKVHKSAVVRNRIRRRIYEIIRRADEPLTAHKDLVFTVFSEQAATIGHDKLAKIITDLLRKAAETPVSHAIVDKRK